MSLLKMPILKELSWVIEGVNELDIKMTKPQKINLIRLLTAVILLSTVTLSTVAVGWMGVISVLVGNRLAVESAFQAFVVRDQVTQACRPGLYKETALRA